MIDMLAANGGRVTNTRRVTYVVLDEADRMFDMGFEPQVSNFKLLCVPFCRAQQGGSVRLEDISLKTRTIQMQQVPSLKSFTLLSEFYHFLQRSE